MTSKSPHNNIVKQICVIGSCIAAVLSAAYLICYFSTPRIDAGSPNTGTQSDILSIELGHSVYPANVRSLPVHIANNYNARVVYTGVGLEQKVDRVWYSLKFRPYETTANELCLEPNEADILSAPLAHYGPRLQPGHYRLVYYIHSPIQGYVTAEFHVAAIL